MITVVAGIIFEHEGESSGRILICQRKATQPHPLKWEFPGGKLEPGEDPQTALTRELHEELGIRSAPAREITRYEFAYPNKPAILLIFLAVTEWQGDVQNRIFERIEWEHPARLREYDFLEGDRPFLETHLTS